MTWRLKRTKQCAKCPWRTDVDPRDIPNGYSEQKHAALCKTIADGDDIATQLHTRDLNAMACHETHDSHCLGWLVNQATVGNNIALRLRLLTCENASEVELTGVQHERFEDTLPS